MAIKTTKGVAVAIERLRADGKDEILKIGTDVWTALVPTSIHEGPIVVSVSLLQSHAGTEERGASLSPSVVCSAVLSKDVQVSDGPYLPQHTPLDPELPSRLRSAFLPTWKSNFLTYLYPSPDPEMLARCTWSR